MIHVEADQSTQASEHQFMGIITFDDLAFACCHLLADKTSFQFVSHL